LPDTTRDPAVRSDRGGGLRKGRFVALALGGMLAASVLGAGIAGGQLPMNISLSGQTFVGTIAAVEGESITVFPRQVDTKAGRLPSVAVLIESARMTDVCLSTVARGLPLVGDVTMFLRVPGDGTTAQDLVVDASALGGSIGASNIRMGADVSATGDIQGVVTSGMVAGGSTMTGARLEGISLAATSLSLRDFHISSEMGDTSC
jgi:hypothetical protein